MKHIKIQIFSTHYAPETTGNAPYVTGLAKGLARNGHDVKVTCGAPHYPEWKIRPSTEWTSRESDGGVEISRVVSYVPRKPNFVNRIVYEVGFGLKLARELDRTADVCLLVSPSLFGSLVVRLGGIFTRSRAGWMLWVQDLYSAGVRETPGFVGPMSGRIITRVESWLTHSVDRVVVIHERFKKIAAQSWGVDPHRVSIIRNWTHVTPTPRTRVDARSQMDWPKNVAVVVHAGNQGAKQGLRHVVQAANYASKQRLPLLFLMVGAGNQREALIKSSTGLQTIRFIDPQPDDRFMEILAAADVLLVNERPSLREAAVPSKLTTYFATGRPVLAATDGDSPTADEVWASGAGVVVDPNDPNGLCEAALKLAGERGCRIGANGPEYVRQELSEQGALLAFEELLAKHASVATKTAGAANTKNSRKRITA